MAAVAAEANIGGADISLRTEAIGQDAPVGQFGDHALHNRMIDAQYREAVERDAADKSVESLLQGGEIAVEVEVLGIDVGDHRRRRWQAGESAVALVGLDAHPLPG